MRIIITDIPTPLSMMILYIDVKLPQDIVRFDIGSRTGTYEPCWGLLR